MSLAKMAVVATAFLQFKDPATNRPIFVTEQFTNADGDTEERQVVDAAGKPLPVGVRLYGPGSERYKNAESVTATQSLKLGRKAMTGDSIRATQTEIMARTVAEYVNFEYKDRTINGAEHKEAIALNTEFFNDVEYVAARDQIAEFQADLGNFSKTAS